MYTLLIHIKSTIWLCKEYKIISSSSNSHILILFILNTHCSFPFFLFHQLMHRCIPIFFDLLWFSLLWGALYSSPFTGMTVSFLNPLHFFFICIDMLLLSLGSYHKSSKNLVYSFSLISKFSLSFSPLKALPTYNCNFLYLKDMT